MSEAAGLALGVVALASLFSTCVELLDYFELGKNYPYDYDLACTKIGILHQRLCNWGDVLRIETPGCEHVVLQDPSKRDAVKRGLYQLSTVLSHTECLRKKYEVCAATQSVQDRGTARGRNKGTSWSLTLRRRTTWSIRDKAKFDRLIDDVSFLIDNLEKVTVSGDLSMATTVNQSSNTISKRQDALESSTAVSVCEEKTLTVRHSSETSATPEAQEGSGSMHSEPPKDHQSQTAPKTDEPRSGESGHIIYVNTRQEVRDQSWGVHGVVGKSAQTSVIAGQQHILDRSFGIVGTGDPQAMAFLAQFHYDRRDNTNQNPKNT